ncbi:MAG: hypothetical protein KME46_33575 [Brasilonema angustatum HA4187-MV1]|jgi:hypothetical protein|nr:hypothetical protein [Brasilonema angustatum HA4187-MV1]
MDFTEDSAPQFDTESYKIDPTLYEINTSEPGEDPITRSFETTPANWVSRTFFNAPSKEALVDLDRDSIKQSGDAAQRASQQAKFLKGYQKVNEQMVDNKVASAKHILAIMQKRYDGAQSLMEVAKDLHLSGVEFKSSHQLIQAQTQYASQTITAETQSRLILARIQFLKDLAAIATNHQEKLKDKLKPEDENQYSLRAQIFRQMDAEYLKYLGALGKYGTPVQNALTAPAKPVYDTVVPKGGAVGQFNTVMRNAAGVFRRVLGL